MKILHQQYEISLMPYQEKDSADFVDIFMNEELCQFMAGGAFDKAKDAENLFEHLLELNLYPEKKSKNFGIFHQEELIGHFELNQNNFTKEDELEIVYLLIKDYWGKGIMQSIIQAFQKEVEGKLIARIKPNNFNSIKMLEKIGIEKQTITKFNNENVLKITLK